MPRKKRIRNQKTPLEIFLKNLREKREISFKEMAGIALSLKVLRKSCYTTVMLK